MNVIQILTKQINVDIFFGNSDEDGDDHTIDKKSSNKHPLTELDLPTSPEPSTSQAKREITVMNVPASLAVQLSTHHATGSNAFAEQLDANCSMSPTTIHGTTLQERMDLEMSVLRRQEAVLKLQEEYYTLKIKLMKKQMEELPK